IRRWGLKPGEGVEKEKASSNAANQSYLTLPDVVEVSTPRSCRGTLLGYAPQPVEELLSCLVVVTTSESRGFWCQGQPRTTSRRDAVVLGGGYDVGESRFLCQGQPRTTVRNLDRVSYTRTLYWARFETNIVFMQRMEHFGFFKF